MQYAVGAKVGSDVGDGVGAKVGSGVGTCVGTAVGTDVGLFVGAAVGTATHSVAPIASLVHVPAAHASHTWYTAASWKRPLGQCSQLVWASMAAIVPASQSVHALPVEAWYWPTAQSVHSVAATVA
jgi:hypothetical protein